MATNIDPHTPPHTIAIHQPSRPTDLHQSKTRMSIDNIVQLPNMHLSKADETSIPTISMLPTPEENCLDSFGDSTQSTITTEPQRLLSPPISPAPIVDPEVYPTQNGPAASRPASRTNSYGGPLFPPVEPNRLNPLPQGRLLQAPQIGDQYQVQLVADQRRRPSHQSSASVSSTASAPASRLPRLPPPCPTGISSSYWIASTYTPDGQLLFMPTVADLAARDPDGYMKMLRRTNALHGLGPLNLLAQAADYVESTSPSPTRGGAPAHERSARAPRARRAAPPQQASPASLSSRRYSSATGESPSPMGPRSTRGKRPSTDDFTGLDSEKVVRKRQRSEKKEKPKSWEELWVECNMYPPPNSSLDGDLEGLPERRRLEARAHRMQPNNLSSAPTSVAAFAAADPTGAAAKLHPWEQECARKLNVTANQYLINKLLCFKRKYERTQNGEGFTKTHAQQVATIDVNKVSKMWEVWERVGWLNNFWFDPKAVMMRAERAVH